VVVPKKLKAAFACPFHLELADTRRKIVITIPKLLAS
jgi:hypothetical protein